MIYKVLSNLVGEGVSKAIPLLVTMAYVKILNNSDFINYVNILIVSEISFLLISNNISAQIKNSYAEANDQTVYLIRGRTFRTLLINSLLGFLVAFVMIFFVDFYYIMLIPIYVLLKSTYIMIQTYYQMQKESNKYIINNLLFFVLFLTVFYITIGFGGHSWLISYIISFLVLILFNRKSFKKFSFKRDRFYKYTSALFIGLVYMPQAISWLAKTSIERYLVQFLFDESFVKVFILTVQLSSLIVSFGMALNMYYAPLLVQELKSGNSRFKEVLTNSFLILLFTACSVYYFLTFITDKIDFLLINKELLAIALFSAMLHAQILILMNFNYFRFEHSFCNKAVTYSIITGLFAMSFFGVFVDQKLMIYMIPLSTLLLLFSIIFKELYNEKRY